MKTLSLFPTTVGIFQVQDSESLNKELSNFIYSIKHEESPQRSMVGGYHTKEDLLTRNNSYIQSFHNIITSQVKEFYFNLTGKEAGPNTKMGSWAMIYGKGHHSRVHVHPLADFSSAYYCKVPKLNEGEGDFIAQDPRPAAKWDRNYTKQSSFTYTPKEGQGIIFPGWLDHYVSPHSSDEDRICITTNVFIDHGTFR